MAEGEKWRPKNNPWSSKRIKPPGFDETEPIKPPVEPIKPPGFDEIDWILMDLETQKLLSEMEQYRVEQAKNQMLPYYNGRKAELKAQLKQGLLTLENYSRELQKLERTYTQSQDWLSKGVGFDQLPIYADVQNYSGVIEQRARSMVGQGGGLWRGETNERALQQAGLARQGFSERMAGVNNEALAAQWENIKNDILGGLNEPANWIQKYQVERIQNPYRTETNLGQEIEKVQGEFEIYDQAAKEIEARLKNPNDTMTLGTIAYPQSSEDQWAASILAGRENIRSRLNQLQSERQADLAMWQSRGLSGFPEGRQATELPETPLAPSWLLGFAPGLKAEQPITKQRVATPSPQQWRTTPYGQREMVRGYSEWAGTPWVDIMQQMENMLPYSPNIPYRWQPQKQRV